MNGQRDRTRQSGAAVVAAAADNRAKKSSVQSSTSNKQHENTKLAAKWSSSGSKFNRILNNIERSILSQFSSSSGGNEKQPSQSTSATTTPTSTKSKSAILTTKSANNLPGELSHRAQMQPDAKLDRVTSELQLKSRELATAGTGSSQPTPLHRSGGGGGSGGGKMILNRCQQQIVSAIQTNKNNRPAASSKSSYSHNRLSIPPPHANDEAQNQNHQLLFGCPRLNQPRVNSTTNDQMTSMHESRADVAKRNTFDQQQSTLFYQNSASPASSAQSLPVTKPAFSQVPQNSSRNNAADDEESGFSTYQSRRLAANTTPNNDRVPSDSCKFENNMMFMQANNQYNSHLARFGLNNLTPQQQIMHQNLLQSRAAQQQSITNNTQQQQQFNNQVPISQSVMYNSNLHIQQQQLNNRPSDNRNQLYGSYGHLGPVPSSQLSMQQHYQPQPLYDGQIYANAPPKPRRYQYYEPPLVSGSHLIQTNRVSQNYPPQQALTFGGQQMNGPLSRQFSYNTSSDQAQTYHQQRGETINAIQIPRRPQRQLPTLPPPSTLTKSKSSLDVADLTRFKLDRIRADGILRVQPQSSNVPIYGSTRLINQMDSSTLQRNPNYHPQATISYHQQHQAPPTNLQRSKSIGNLLPDYNTHELNLTQQQMAPIPTNNHLQQQSIVSAHPKFLTVSSASTNNLNYIGLANNTTVLVDNGSQGIRQSSQLEHQQVARLGDNSASSSSRQQHQRQNVPSLPMRQSYQGAVNGGAFWPDKPQNQSTARNNGDGTTKTDTNFVSNSGKTIRQSQNGAPPAEGFVTQSLDDKIRHLLIGNDGINSGTTNNSNSKTESREVASAWTAQQQQSQLQMSRQTQLSQKEAVTRPKPVAGVSKSFAGSQQDRAQVISSKCNNQVVENHNHTHEPNMGNRHQRQYQVGGPNTGALDQQMRVNHQRATANHGDGMSFNSQLIVDLTTPRVLAKTQTTLLPATSLADQTPRPQQFRGKEAWSMNQLGLPTNYVDQFALSAMFNQSSGAMNRIDAPDVVSFPAPYYYSDLKSEEQQRALMNIVQQKSLSPPPQLLSRSIDQSNTRLAPKSATMHAGQARMLSESLAASQRRLQSNGQLQDSKSTNNIPNVSSNSSVAKNIDKLFDSPVDPQLGQPVGGNRLHSVQSMLALSSEPANEESCSAMSRVPSEQNQIESLSNSSGYCSDAWKKAVSKSRSLENISQQQSQPDGIDPSVDKPTVQDKLRRHGNPVYENIRRSDKLLSAINNSTTCLSTSSTRNRKPRTQARPQPASGSDSMDSILGSSFDDDDDVDDSDDTNPADVDSDNSTTGIEFIKLSPTTADMSELIEQLKNNHAKLTDEYKSTLARISKILNRKDSSGKRKVSDKLAGRLLRLENKSKKCESRSKNQLALIQMMEKAFRQTEQESAKDPDTGATGPAEANKSCNPADSDNRNPLPSDTGNSPQDSIALKQASLSCMNTSPCHSIDYQNLEHNSGTPSEPELAPPPPPVVEAQNVIKAIVTEATSAEIPKKFVAELTSDSRVSSTTKPTDPVSLSTRYQQEDRNNKSLSNGTVGRRIQSIESIVKRSSKNPFRSEKPDDNASVMQDKVDNNKETKNSGSFYEDEDDFIEFMSTGRDSTHGRSQFESSQFSASDFNNSSSSGSTSESSHSGSVTTDSLDISSPLLKKNGKTTPIADDKSSLKKRQNNRSSNGNSNSNNNNNNDNTATRNKKNGSNNEKTKGENKFKNVLGNVIDVDVYPVNNMIPSSSSSCSPVSNNQ